MSDDENKSLVPHRSELPSRKDSLKRVPSEIIDKLSPKQQKAATMLVTTTLNEKQVAQHLGISKRKLTRWMKEPAFKALMAHTQERLYQDDLEVTRAQMKKLRESMFIELMGRFDEFDPSVIPQDASVSEIMLEKKRYAHFADFKDFLKGFIEIDRRMSENRREEHITEEDDEVWSRVQQRFRKKTLKRKRKEKLFEEQGVAGDDFFNVMNINPDGTVSPNQEVLDKIDDEYDDDVEVEEEHEVVVEQVKLTKRRGQDE